MNIKSNPLHQAVLLALLATASQVHGQTTTTPAAAGQAESQEKKDLDRVVVTGSRIRSADVETSQPVFAISRENLQAQGQASVADVLQNMTIAGSPPISRSAVLSSGEAVGGQYIDLRNLGASRTLVLVDGKRLPITTSGLQDISAVPNIMVSRIDVLKAGASSTYGSDAIAGVINIITRKRFNGAEAEVHYGMYDVGDGGKGRVSAVLGAAGEKAWATVGLEYRDEKEVWARNRWFSKDTYPGRPASSLTTVGQWGNFNNATSGAAVWYAPNRGGSALGVANFHPQTSADTSNSADQMHVMNPLSARTAYLSGGYDFSDKLRWTADLGFSNRKSVRQIAGYPLQSTSVNAPMAATSIYNPVGRSVSWRRRGWEVPRVTTSDLTSWRLVSSLEGSMNLGTHYMDWEAGASYATNNLTVNSVGNFNILNVRAAVGPSFVNSSGVAQCGTPTAVIAGCVPWNPFAGFGTGAVANSLEDPAVQKFLFPTEQATGKTSTRLYFANISGNLFSMPAGDLKYALGWENRQESGRYTPDAMTSAGYTTNLAAGPTKGNYSVNEFFGELEVPVLANVPFAQELTFNLASRYSKYSTFGSTTNSKASFKWKPIADLLVRGTWAQGFRAPTISDLYFGGSETFTTGFMDPCDSVYGDARGTANCLRDVPAGYRQLQQGFVPTTSKAAQIPLPFVSGSNPLLQPEKSKTLTAGFVYSPSFLTGLNIGLDWWKINITDTMVSDSPNLIMEDCYIAGIASRCSMFTRDPVTHIVTGLKYGLRNAGFTRIKGYDLSIGYRFKTENYGQFSINSDSTYFSKYETKATNDPTTPVQQNVGFGSTFRLRSNLILGWDMGPVAVNWTTRYFSSIKENCYFTTECTIPNYASPGTRGIIVPKNRKPGVAFNDVQVRVKTPANSTVALGVNNVFKRYGPVTYSQPNSNFSYYGGFDIGRFFYMRYTQKF